MQEQTVAAAPLRVWPFTLAASATALVVGILTIPIHLVKHMAMARHFETYGVRVPGGPGPGMPLPSLPPGVPPPGMPGGPEAHGVWIAAHPGLGIEWAIIGLIVIAVYAGVAGAVFAAVYNAIVSRRS